MLINPTDKGNSKSNSYTSPTTSNKYAADGRMIRNMPEIKQGETIHFATDGSFALHDLIVHLIKQTGPAHLKVVSYSISTEAARILLNYFENGWFYSLTFLLDDRAKNANREAVNILKEHFEIHFNKVHAKCALIRNDNWTISAIGSANLTDNPRTERGAIFTDIETYNFDNTWINELS